MHVVNEPMLFAKWVPSAWRVVIAKHDDAGDAGGGCEMHRTAIVANEQGGALHDGGALPRIELAA